MENLTIGIISPASGDDSSTIDLYINNFKKLGFNIKEGKNLRKKHLYLSGTDKERATDLNEMFLDENIDAIICFRGGYGSIRMIPFIDFKAIKKNPKPFYGYSDITLLLNYINKKTGLVTYHGPMIKSDFTQKETLQYLKKSLVQKSSYEIDLNQFPNIISYSKDIINGQINGGNLSIICSSLSTPYEINFKNSILLLEEINEDSYSIDRMISQLISTGKLKDVKGFLLGHFTPSNTITQKILLDLLLPLNKPILTGIPIGHDYPNITIPIGQKCTIDYSKKKIFI